VRRVPVTIADPSSADQRDCTVARENSSRESTPSWLVSSWSKSMSAGLRAAVGVVLVEPAVPAPVAFELGAGAVVPAGGVAAGVAPAGAAAPVAPVVAPL